MESVRTQYVTVKEIFNNCPKLKKGSTWRKIPEIAQLGKEKKGKNEQNDCGNYGAWPVVKWLPSICKTSILITNKERGKERGGKKNWKLEVKKKKKSPNWCLKIY